MSSGMSQSMAVAGARLGAVGAEAEVEAGAASEQ